MEAFERSFSVPSFSLSGHLPGLQELRVEYTPTPNTARQHLVFHQTYGPLIQESSRGIPRSLRVLSLSIPLESYQHKAFDFTHPLPALERLELKVFTIYLSTDWEEVLESNLAPLVNVHSTTLRSLSITFEPRFSYRDRYFYKSHRFFRALGNIPRLSTLKLQLQMTSPQQTELAGLCQFIRAHSSTLTTLHLSLFNSIHYRYNDDCWEPEDSVITELFTPQTLFSHDLFTKVLPSCRMVTDFKFQTLFETSLERAPGPFVTWFPSLKWAEHLVTLALPYNRFLLTDFIDVILAVNLPVLQNLEAHFPVLTTSLFDILEPRLRRLRKFKIRAAQIEPKVDADNTQHPLLPTSTFLTDIEECDYSSWTSLIDLDIQLTTNPTLNAAPLRLRAALMSAFPNLLYCNEKPT
ncbi:hypothetical protein H1R20_g330, partial [Candolleomyces eurysporus]